MREVELNLPPRCSDHQIEAAIVAAELRITLRTTLKTFPGCLHWHIQREGARGTLEITFLPAAKRAWFKVSGGRGADWIDPAISRVQLLLQKTKQKRKKT